MTQTTASEFKQNLQEYQRQAEREPIEITRDGQPKLVLMSANHYDWLRAAAQRAHQTKDDVSPAILDAIESAEMDERHRHLDDLLK